MIHDQYRLSTMIIALGYHSIPFLNIDFPETWVQGHRRGPGVIFSGHQVTLRFTTPSAARVESVSLGLRDAIDAAAWQWVKHDQWRL